MFLKSNPILPPLPLPLYFFKFVIRIRLSISMTFRVHFCSDNPFKTWNFLFFRIYNHPACFFFNEYPLPPPPSLRHNVFYISCADEIENNCAVIAQRTKSNTFLVHSLKMMLLGFFLRTNEIHGSFSETIRIIRSIPSDFQRNNGFDQ